MKILVAIDGSPCSTAALQEVAQRPWPPKSEARVVTVDAPVDRSLFAEANMTAFDALVASQRAESHKRLTEAAKVLGGSAAELAVTTEQLEGWPKDAIVEDAERWGADLVVVGSHGRGPLHRLFLGSVSQFVANRAPCSVLIVRPPPKAAPPTA